MLYGFADGPTDHIDGFPETVRAVVPEPQLVKCLLQIVVVIWGEIPFFHPQNGESVEVSSIVVRRHFSAVGKLRLLLEDGTDAVDELVANDHEVASGDILTSEKRAICNVALLYGGVDCLLECPQFPEIGTMADTFQDVSSFFVFHGCLLPPYSVFLRDTTSALIYIISFSERFCQKMGQKEKVMDLFF